MAVKKPENKTEVKKETPLVSGRVAEIKRKTKETDITCKINIDGNGKYDISTGIGFFDHMLESFTKHSGVDLSLVANGDLRVDNHHTVEDTGIVLGQAIAKALGEKKGINRYASFVMPMDDALVLCAIDISGRPYLNFDYDFKVERVGYFETETLKEFFYALSYSAGMNIHFKIMDGDNTHHIIEAMFKAFANALKIAATVGRDSSEVLSTKGSL